MFPFKVEFIRKLDKLPQDFKEAILGLMEYFEILSKDMVRREDFNELRSALVELAEAQKRTEERIAELAEAQRRTEERVGELERAVSELAEAQRRTEERIAELAEAQRRTEERVGELERIVSELAEAQRRTEERVGELERVVSELAKAQKRTEAEIEKLSRGLRNLREEVAGLARSFSYALENEAYRRLPEFLKERYGIEVLDRLIRFDLDGEEINLFARVKKNGEELLLVGESVTKLVHARELKLLERKIRRVREIYGKDVLGMIVTHFAKRTLKERAESLGYIVVQSFEW